VFLFLEFDSNVRRLVQYRYILSFSPFLIIIIDFFLIIKKFEKSTSFELKPSIGSCEEFILK
jgi:hypothetical protein